MKSAPVQSTPANGGAHLVHCGNGKAIRKKRSPSVGCVAKPKNRREFGMMDALRGLYFLSHVSRIKTENFVSRLHILTSVLLLTFSITVTTRQAVGNPIDCVHTRDIPVEVFNAYCWVHSTYFVTAAMLGSPGVNVAFPGVGASGNIFNHMHDQRHQQQDHIEYHRVAEGLTKQVKYYQWVAFTLFFQSTGSRLAITAGNIHRGQNLQSDVERCSVGS